MADQWYFSWDNQGFGPFSEVQLKELADLGRLQPSDTVWKEGVDKGVLASKIDRLFPESSMPDHGAHQRKKLDPWLTSPPDRVTPGEHLVDVIPDGLMLAAVSDIIDPALPGDAPPVESPIVAKIAVPKKTPKRGRATAVMGAGLISQDGETVRYRKKCTKCGYEDSSSTSMPIRNGDTREHFFCPKCKKMSDVVIQGII
jgi:DNA-directed RNA polymerase subunit M/transcription elongation factor TFIIS